MKVHKNFITKRIPLLACIFINSIASQAAVLDTITESADHAINSMTSSLKELIGNDEVKSKGQRIGFSHYGFFKSYDLSEKNKISAKIITSQKKLNQFLKKYQPENVIQKPIDFKKEIILAVETTHPQSWAIKIKKLYFHDFFSLYIQTKNQTATCSTTSQYRSRTHLIKVDKPEKEFAHIDKFELLGEDSSIECPPEENNTLPMPFQHTTLISSKISTLAFPQPFLNVLSYQWGEWDIFKKRHCPSCSDLYAPGLPKTASIISIVDKAPLTEELGEAKLVLHQIQGNDHHWIVHLERVIDLCSQDQRNSPLLIFAAPPRHFIKEVHTASGFIGESQKICHSPQKNK